MLIETDTVGIRIGVRTRHGVRVRARVRWVRVVESGIGSGSGLGSWLELGEASVPPSAATAPRVS